MNDYFQLPVEVDGCVVEFEARLLLQGYIYRVEVIVDDIPVSFEPDEERNYRALVTIEQMEGKAKHLKGNLLGAIAMALQSLPDQ